MIGDVTSIHRSTLGPNYELAGRLKDVGIDPYQIKAPDIIDPKLICHSFEAIMRGTTNDLSLERLDHVKRAQRFMFYIEPDEDDWEIIGYRPNLLIDPDQPEENGDVLAVHVNPKAIGRMIAPLVSLARANELVVENDPHDINYRRVVRVAVSSAFGLALSYAAFCQFGKFDTENPFEPCVELEAIAEESGIEISDDQPSGVWLRAIALRFAGGVAMRYTAQLAAQEFEVPDSITRPEDDMLKYGIILKSMALKDRLSSEHSTDQPVSYALEHAYTPAQLQRISNLWFRVPEERPRPHQLRPV